MCTVILKTPKKVQTDSAVLTKSRAVKILQCFPYFYQKHTDQVTVLGLSDLSALILPKIHPTLFFRQCFTASDVMVRYLFQISMSFAPGFSWCLEDYISTVKIHLRVLNNTN